MVRLPALEVVYLLTILIYVHKALYAEMKEGILADQTDYASQPLKDHLKGVSKP